MKRREVGTLARSATLVLTLLAITALSNWAVADNCEVGNLGYNSYEGYLSNGQGLNKWFGPGVGYESRSADYFRRYVPPEQWGQFGYGTGHLNEGYGPYIYPPREGGSPPGMYDPPPAPYLPAPPPSIKVKNGNIRVALPNNIPGIVCVTATVLAYNGAELIEQSVAGPPYVLNLPVTDGARKVRVRIEYVDNGLSATSYPL